MLMVNQLTGFGAFSSASSATVTWTDSAEDNVSATTTTYTGKAIGTAAAGRLIVVGFWGPRIGGTTGTQSSVTVGGISATNITGANVNNTSDGNTSRAQLWVAEVPTGTTANIVTVVNSGGGQAIGVWAIYGASTSTPTGSNVSTSTALPASLSLNIPAGGVGIAFTGDINAGGFTSIVWSGLTENFDVRASNSRSGASLAFASAQTALAITGTYTSGARPAAVAAAWGPL